MDLLCICIVFHDMCVYIYIYKYVPMHDDIIYLSVCLSVYLSMYLSKFKNNIPVLRTRT